MSDIKYISTSALSKKLSIAKHQLDEKLLAANFIERKDEGFILTDTGIKNGGCMKKHPKFGDYIAWDENIEIPNKLITQGKEFFSSTKIASKYNLSLSTRQFFAR